MSGVKSTAKRRRNLKLGHCAKTKSFLKIANTKLCLSSLNCDVLNHLLLFLDVPSLQQLAKTCTLFYQLISGQIITNLHVPLSKEFLHEVQNAAVFEKKPILRMILSEAHLEAEFGAQSDFIGFSSREFVTSLFKFQFSLLDLTKLRDLVIKPSTRGNGSCNIFFMFCGRQVLHALARCGVLCRLTRFKFVLWF